MYRYLLLVLNSLVANHLMSFQDVPEKNRVPGLDKDYEEITGSCLVYRFMNANGSGLQDPTRTLSLTRGLALMIRRNILVS